MITKSTIDHILTALRENRLSDVAKIGADTLGPVAAEAFVAGIALGRAPDGEIPDAAKGMVNALAAATVGADGFRMLRENLGITRNAVAEKLGVAVNTVQQWETGVASLPPTAILALTKLAGDAINTVAPSKTITGNQLCQIRTALGIGREKFAQALGVPYITIRIWEDRKERPLTNRSCQRIGPALEKLMREKPISLSA